MTVQSMLPILIAVGFSHALGEPTSALRSDMSPVRKVVTLLEEMKEQVEKEASDDQLAHEKYMCWCKTNEEAKTQAISDAERRIEGLAALIEEMIAKESRLKTEIEGLKQGIVEDQDALATATATREKESAAFQAEEADLKETLGLLKEAVAVLSKVQLVQKQDQPPVAAVQTALMQIRNKIEQRPAFQSLMKRDLFEVLGSFETMMPQHRFLPRKSAALVEQHGSLLPWEKTDEQVGEEAKPNDLVGAAADAKSYNSRSGRILGILSEMADETGRDLTEAQKEDARAETAFQKLRDAKLGEIAVAQEQQKRKEADLAETLATAADAKQDKEATEGALSADEQFLSNMLKDCKFEDEEYHKRLAVRSDELVALSETLKILMADDARDFFGKTVTLLQVEETNKLAIQDHLADKAMKQLVQVAQKHQNWALASLAVRVRLDAFTKVKEAMDKMLSELAKQQKEEYAKWEQCKSDIDLTEDEIKSNTLKKEDLEEKHTSLTGTIERLQSEIEELRAEEEQMKVSLKEAGEQRKQQNLLFQTSITDQRATTSILQKALARLQQFYKAELVQVSMHDPENKPGRAVAPPPSKGQDYAKSGGSGAVMQLLMKIIENSEVEEQQLSQDEQRSQQLYEEFVQTAAATIEAARVAMSEKSTRLAETESAKSETEEALLATGQVLEKLSELLKNFHLECDYLLKYFDIRQQARAEEIDAITDAKAVLSGADFGK